MKANELMIGDWVEYSSKYKHGIGKIAGIEPREGSVEPTTFTVIDDNLMLIGVSRVNVVPIPLTPEILEKNGWYHGRFDGSYGRKAMRLDGPYKDKLPDGVDNALSFAQWSIDEKFEYHLLNVYLWKGSVRLWIEYVHELQHVFKLCGIEKEIKL